MYGTSVCLPTSAELKQPSAGAAPPSVFKRWINVAWVINLPPVGPSRDPIDCSKRHGIAPGFGQLASEPEVTDGVNALAHTALLSKTLCHVGLPKGSGFGANSFGFVSGLRK